MTTRLVRLRERVHAWPGGDATWRVLVVLVGGALVVGGLLLVPLPGPGWLIVFLGLTVLASEFVWAQRLLTLARARLAAFNTWLGRQPPVIRGAFALLTVGFVAAVIGVYFAINGWWPFGRDETAAAPDFRRSPPIGRRVAV